MAVQLRSVIRTDLKAQPKICSYNRPPTSITTAVLYPAPKVIHLILYYVTVPKYCSIQDIRL